MSDDRPPPDDVRSGPAAGDPENGATSAIFDRVLPPNPMRVRHRDVLGKRALYSVDPEANPTPLLRVRCERCEVERGLTAGRVLRLLLPPWLFNPCRRMLWARCPTCQRRTWLRLSLGPGITWPFRSGPS